MDNNSPIISGIQQIGIGVPDVHKAFTWYRQHLGFDIPVFEEAAPAPLMTLYTGGVVQKRHAILALNMKGGGGLEIWQYTSRVPQPPPFELQLGDTGIYCMKINSANVYETYTFLKSKNVNIMCEIQELPSKEKSFFFRDLYGNLMQITEGSNWFGKGKKNTGGVAGCWLGVKDMEKSIQFYKTLFGYDKVIYDKTDVFADLKNIPGGEQKLRRVLLHHIQPRKGSFSKLLGNSSLELVQTLDRKSNKIFENRFWGDQGYIHLCFDVANAEALKKQCEQAGHPFVIDSGTTFDMGEAGGRFSYIEDPDGTLIEMVETHKVPIMKKLGWYLDLRKRNPESALPDWMVKAMGISRVKD